MTHVNEHGAGINVIRNMVEIYIFPRALCFNICNIVSDPGFSVGSRLIGRREALVTI